VYTPSTRLVLSAGGVFWERTHAIHPERWSHTVGTRSWRNRPDERRDTGRGLSRDEDGMWPSGRLLIQRAGKGTPVRGRFETGQVKSRSRLDAL
jgi:hypothetical protein